jgi:hypothetical protein
MAIACQITIYCQASFWEYFNSLLARILTPLVFSQTETLRRTPALRDAALLILDVMVEQGSSAAFRMRDFLITPITPHPQSSGNEPEN